MTAGICTDWKTVNVNTYERKIKEGAADVIMGNVDELCQDDQFLVHKESDRKNNHSFVWL